MSFVISSLAVFVFLGLVVDIVQGSLGTSPASRNPHRNV